jgi:tetratricopeptide (TPR) repeat protein
MPSTVLVRREPLTLPTYTPHAPDQNPMFLEKRVYQGSSGKVYPLPFIDRIAEKPVPHRWDAIHLENEFLSVVILPELGGRIHALRDKTNGYDLIYNQAVIKPALVGLAGPWASGGIEFNWPQHHRPSTFLPAEVAIEKAADGSVTVWLSEHDPMGRMKGMHGVHLAPGRAIVELKVRLYNRTLLPQTFLWWANVATRVHEHYQSFFPPDVTHVVDHAKRAMSEYPLAKGRYYGVNYGARPKHGVPAAERPTQFVPPGTYAPNDLSWYANIPVPTSYMCIGSAEDFFGGYDHAARAGLVHLADHHLAPGKKQWTWGNHAFGYAWDRNLTDADARGEFAPYIELMAGVFTDNQPDFSWLAPGETKTWSQYWYPIREIGPAQKANRDAAVSLGWSGTRERRAARLGVAVTARHAGATLRLIHRGRIVSETPADLAPASPGLATVPLPRGARETDLTVVVLTAEGRELIRYTPQSRPQRPVPAAATAPPAPRAIQKMEELYLTGLHLDQYRHATRDPAAYWREALRRDPGDARCNAALGLWQLRRGEFSAAEKFLRAAIARLTARNPNPADGEPYYHLGVCLRHQAAATAGRALRPTVGDKSRPAREALLDAAYDAFYKSTWNAASQPAAFHALAEIDCCRGDWPRALAHLAAALRRNTENLRARNLRVMVLRRLGEPAEMDLAAILSCDPLDAWARHLSGQALTGDTQTRLDLVHDYLRAGFHREALALLATAAPEPASGTAPIVAYTAAWICHLIDDKVAGRRHRALAAAAAPDYCFPARLEEIHVLRHAMAANPRDARAPYYLGNLLYDRRRHREAMALWETSARLEPKFSVVWRNLGIGYFNLTRAPARARAAYDRAVRVNPRDARLIYERDQLWKRLGVSPAARRAELDRHREIVAQRDDHTLEFCALLTLTGRTHEALPLLAGRTFQPWEGGEGVALGQHVRAHLVAGQQTLAAGDPADAARLFSRALSPPENLGEARHLLANQSDVHFWLGCALDAGGDRALARRHWTAAATFRGDFQAMSVRAFSEMTYFSALALAKLGRRVAARKLLRGLLAHARQLARTPATIDYFATSLPTMLLFDDDLDRRQKITALFLEAQARAALGERAAARRLLTRVRRMDPAHAMAADLFTELSAKG